MSKIKLNVQHEYITLGMPNGNFTISYNGYKCSGGLSFDQAGFDSLVKFVKDKNNGKNMGEIMAKLANEEVLSKVWPNWDKPAKVTIYQIGAKVKIAAKLPDGSPIRVNPAKYGIGVVTEDKGKKSVTVRWEHAGLIGMQRELIEPV